MKLIKQFTCLVVCFVVLSSSFMVGYAVDDFEPVYPLPEDLEDLGFVLDKEGNYAYYGKDDPFDFGFSFNLLNEPNYKYFDIKSLPWRSFPDYIQSILKLKPDTYMPYLTDVSADVSAYTKSIPFVLVRAYDTNLCDIYVGYNVFIGRYNDAAGSLNVFARKDIDSACYYARFDFEGNTVINWSRLSLTTPWSSVPIGYYQTYSIGDFQRVVDYYFYGGNVVKPTDSPLSSLSYQGLTSGGLTVTGLQSDIGFASSRFFPLQDQYSYIYSTYFEIPDYNQLIQEEQNQILDKQNGILDELLDEFRSSGESELTTLPGEALEDYNKAESDLVSGYNPDNIDDDLDIELDPSALSFIWDLFDEFVTADNSVFTLFISVLGVGIIALILGR